GGDGSDGSGASSSSTSGDSATETAMSAATGQGSGNGSTGSSGTAGSGTGGGSDSATSSSGSTSTGSGLSGGTQGHSAAGGLGGSSNTSDPLAGNVSPVCFRPGTAIATPTGQAAIETLRPGDLVLTADGEALPVLWIGRQSLASGEGDPLRVHPIRIRAGALGPRLPARDLYVSPDHALALNGVLVHAGALVDGTAIQRQDDPPALLVYYHIELERHALVLAEGVPAESFVDNPEQLTFDNGDERAAALAGRQPCAEMDWPRAKAARQVPMAIRRRLADRAALLAAIDTPEAEAA
ncbi:Hint domain-containing protein, partial [Aureimonas sp. AU20]